LTGHYHNGDRLVFKCSTWLNSGCEKCHPNWVDSNDVVAFALEAIRRKFRQLVDPEVFKAEVRKALQRTGRPGNQSPPRPGAPDQRQASGRAGYPAGHRGRLRRAGFGGRGRSDRSNRNPLVLRGTRQVGKTWLVRSWGAQRFGRVVEVNLERRPETTACFTDNDPID